MPYSAPCFNDLEVAIIRQLTVRKALDVGIGAGKFGLYLRAAWPEAHITGIELEPQYVERFGLEAIYNTVWVGRCLPFLELYPEATWDIATLGDVLEHMPRSEGLDVIHALSYRTRHLLVVFPDRMPNGPWEGFVSEVHRSVWVPEDFAFMAYRARFDGNMRLVLAEGFTGESGDDPECILSRAEGADR